MLHKRVNEEEKREEEKIYEEEKKEDSNDEKMVRVANENLVRFNSGTEKYLAMRKNPLPGNPERGIVFSSVP